MTEITLGYKTSLRGCIADTTEGAFLQHMNDSLRRSRSRFGLKGTRIRIITVFTRLYLWCLTLVWYCYWYKLINQSHCYQINTITQLFRRSSHHQHVDVTLTTQVSNTIINEVMWCYWDKKKKKSNLFEKVIWFSTQKGTLQQKKKNHLVIIAIFVNIKYHSTLNMAHRDIGAKYRP